MAVSVAASARHLHERHPKGASAAGTHAHTCRDCLEVEVGVSETRRHTLQRMRRRLLVFLATLIVATAVGAGGVGAATDSLDVSTDDPSPFTRDQQYASPSVEVLCDAERDGPRYRGSLDARALVAVLRSAGWSEDVLVAACCVTWHESAWRSDLISAENYNGTRDYGLFQINSIWAITPDPYLAARHGPFIIEPTTTATYSDAVYNSHYAHHIWEQYDLYHPAGGWSPWFAHRHCERRRTHHSTAAQRGYRTCRRRVLPARAAC